MAEHVRARHAPGDDRGSMVMAALLIMVASMLALLLVPLIIAQINTSRFDTRRGHALDAAQAGVDVVLGQLRSATSSGVGDLGKLPCGTTFAGAVSTGGTARYEARVYYFSADPRGHDDWAGDSTKQISCLSGQGVAVTPGYGMVVSRGTDSTTGSFDTVATRTIHATYVFKTKNNNVPGGLIHSYGSDPELCLDAGSSSPAIGTVATFRPCAAGTAQQLWSFNTNLTISLAATVNGPSDLGVCLSAPAAYPHASGDPVTLQNCSSTTSPQQRWGYNGSSNFVATTSAGRQDSLCMGPASPNTADANLTLVSCGARDTGHAFSPDGAVGAGNADGAHKFLVNYNQFGRCLDITNQKLPQDAGTKYLISYPCKVAPDTASTPACTPTSPVTVTASAPANQWWCLPSIPTGATSATGQITSIMDSSYCLVSPMTLNGNPYMEKCANVTANQKKWTVWGDTGEYTTSYRISDASTPSASSSLGYCLQPTDTTDIYTKIIVSDCTGTTLQKWNAPPGVVPIPVKDYHEK